MEEHLLPRAAEAQVAATLTVRRGRPFAGILAEADAVDAALVALGRHRDENEDDLFVGSTGWRVLRESRRPVLQVRDPAAAPYGRILAAVDCTPAAEEALRLACRFAAGAEFSAVHAFTVPFVDELPSYETRQAAGAERQRELEQIVGEMLRALPQGGVPPPLAVHSAAQPGDVLEVIRRECDRIKPDLLVVATRGGAGGEGAFQRSIAESLLRRPPCDVAAVAAPARR
jgi:nucleotide-binding universal stress UspA family protein